MRSWLLIAALSLTLTACFTSGKRGGERAMVIYDLGFREMATPVARQSRSGTTLEVRAPLWFDSLGIHYRLNYSEPARLREYGLARWAGPPAQMIQQQLTRDLGMVPAGQARSSCVLRIDVEEFSQIFDGPESSRAVMQVRAQWLDSSRKQIVERRLQFEEPAISPNAQGGVHALTKNVTQLSLWLQEWAREESTVNRLAACLG